jgi:F-type H+-transporting ATPase subunit b
MSARTDTAVEHGKNIAKFPPLDSTTFAPQLIWLAITFGLLYLLMRRIFLPRVGAILAERRGQIERDFASAERFRIETKEAIARYEEALSKARAAAGEIVKTTRDKAAADTHQERVRIEKRIAASIAEADTRLAAAKAQALAGVDEIASDVAGAIVAHMIGKVVTTDEVKRALTRRAAEQGARNRREPPVANSVSIASSRKSRTGPELLTAAQDPLLRVRKRAMFAPATAVVASVAPERTRHCAAVTKISTRSLSARATPMQARCGGLARSTHSSQARSISGLRPISVI